MKPGVVIQLLSPHLKPDELLIVHITHKDGTRYAFCLKDFDAAFAHGYHIVSLDDQFNVTETWIDIDSWALFSIDHYTTMDQLKVQAETFKKLHDHQRAQPHPLQAMFGGDTISIPVKQ